MRNLSAGTTTLLSVGRDGFTPARLGAFGPSLSGAGDCVAFGSRSDDLVSPSYGPDFNHVYLRAAARGCPVDATPSGPGGATPGGPGGVTGKPTRNKVAPRILHAHLTHRRFATGGGQGRGTAILFTLTENASTTITITRHAPGRRSGKHCVAPRHGLVRRCSRTLTAGELFKAHARAGGNRIAFNGRVGGVALRPGSYQVHLQARDAAGNRSRTVTLTFVVLGRGAGRATA